MPGERYTEFSVLRPESGKADLPLTVTSNGPYPLAVTVVNRELTTVSYRLQVSDDRGYLQNIPLGTLGNGKSQTLVLEYPLQGQGPFRRLTLELFRDGDTKSYRQLHLWIYTRTGNDQKSTGS